MLYCLKKHGCFGQTNVLYIKMVFHATKSLSKNKLKYFYECKYKLMIQFIEKFINFHGGYEPQKLKL